MGKNKGKNRSGAQAAAADAAPTDSPRTASESEPTSARATDAGLVAELDAARGEIAALKAQLAARDAEIAALKAEKAGAPATPAPDIQKLQDRLASLKKEQADADAAREAAWRQLKTVVNEISKLAGPDAKPPAPAATA